jgi:mannose-1-phosphate guanylyltransferase/phosphomannomutase
LRLDVGGEQVFLVDDKGRILEQLEVTAVLADLALQPSCDQSMAVPVSAPSVFEAIAERHGGHVIRTRVDPQDLMQAAIEEDIVFAGDATGNYIFPAFQPAIDGLMAIAKLLQFLAIRGAVFSDVVDGLPDYFMARRRVDCPWEMKGTVMRRLNEDFQRNQEPQIDGVKIHLNNGDWVLILPDPDKPVFRILAEAGSNEEAAAVADHYARIVEELQHK